MEFISSVIIVDSCYSLSRKQIIEKYIFNNLGSSVILKILSNPEGLPGGNRNVGIRESNAKWIAFIDSKIKIKDNYFKFITLSALRSNADVVYASCFFSSNKPFESAICALSYGYNVSKSVLPASIIKRQLFFKDINFFREDIRAGEDILLMRDLKENALVIESSNAIAVYDEFPDSFNKVYLKWSLYQYHLSSINRQNFSITLLIVFYILIFIIFFIKIKYGLLLLAIYLAARAFLISCIRSKNLFWWRCIPKSFIYLFPVAIVIDVSKVVGYIKFVFHMKDGNEKV